MRITISNYVQYNSPFKYDHAHLQNFQYCAFTPATAKLRNRWDIFLKRTGWICPNEMRGKTKRLEQTI